MEKIAQQENNLERYLKSGPQTQISPAIMEIASNIKGTTAEKIDQIFRRISLMRMEGFNSDIFRRRMADEIILDGNITGCTDAALVFITLARACDIPAKYVETIDEGWLKVGGDHIAGHIYSEIYDKETEGWRWVDPMGMSLDTSPKSRVVFREGLDSWDIGINDYEAMRNKFEEFRNEYNK